jgi:hypothetical protein
VWPMLVIKGREGRQILLGTVVPQGPVKPWIAKRIGQWIGLPGTRKDPAEDRRRESYRGWLHYQGQRIESADGFWSNWKGGWRVRARDR